MGVVNCILKFVLVICNMILLKVSLILIILGCIIVSGTDLFKSVLNNVLKSLNSELSDTGFKVDTANLSLQPFFEPLAYGFIAIGCVVGTLSLLGYIGAYYSIKLILFIYAIIIGVLLLVQGIIAALVYSKSAFNSTAKKRLKDLLTDYSGIEGKNGTTLAWNAVMEFLHCCGVNNYKDFEGLRNWPPSTLMGKSLSELNLNLTTPLACCKDLNGTDFTCATVGEATDVNNNMNVGCYDKILSLITGHPGVITIVVSIIGFQAALFISAILIMSCDI